MSRQSKTARGGSPHRAPREGRRSDASARLPARRAIAFLAALALVAYLALDGGGYDILVRQTVAIVVWGVIAVGFAHGVLPRGSPGRLALVPLVAAAGLVLWMLLSFAWTASDERTMAEIARFLGYAGIAVLALTALNRHTFRAAAAGLSVAALGIVVLAVASRLAPGAFPGTADLAAQFGTDRLAFPLDSWNAIGAWGAMACAIGLAWSANARVPLIRTISLAAVPVAVLAVYLSYSRVGVVGVATAVVAVLVLSRNRSAVVIHALAAGAGAGAAILAVRANPEIAEATGGAGAWQVLLALAFAAAICAGAALMTARMRMRMPRSPRDRPRWALPALAAVVLAVAVAAVLGPISDWWTEFRTEGAPASGSDPAQRLSSAGGSRDDIWASAIDAFAEEPLQGLGPGTFEFWWLREADHPEYVRDAHSLYFEHAAELGLPGLLLLVAALGGLGAVALAARRSLDRPEDIAASVALISAFAIFCVNAGFDWLWEETAVAVFGIGAASVAAAAGSSRRSRSSREGTLFKPGARAAVVVGAVLAALAQVPGIVSTERVRASEEALHAGDLDGARSLAEQAIDAQPWAARPHGQLAVVEREAGELDVAENEIEKAIEREPTNWEWPLVLALIQADADDRQAAIQTFTDGRRLAPNLPFYSPFFVYGQQLFTYRELERRILRAGAEEPAE